MIYLLLLLSVLLGFVLVFLVKPSHKIIRLLLAFSGAYLLSVTVLHLLPEVYQQIHAPKTIGILILVGIIFQSILESFSKGAEHGHIHIHAGSKKFPTLLFVSLCIHALTEGLPIENATDNLLWAIVVHKIPIAIVLTVLLLDAKYAKRTIFIFLTVFGLMSPLGVFLSEKIPFLEEYHTEVTALIIGIFLHISTVILFETSENHTFNFQKFTAILLGILLTVFTL